MMYKANVRFYNISSTKYIDIDIGNRGTSDTKITQVYIGTSSANRVNQTIAPSNLPAGGVQTITVGNYSWEEGKTYYFNIVSSAQNLEFSEQAPMSS
jgi:hypothetical protein